MGTQENPKDQVPVEANTQRRPMNCAPWRRDRVRGRHGEATLSRVCRVPQTPLRTASYGEKVGKDGSGNRDGKRVHGKERRRGDAEAKMALKEQAQKRIVGLEPRKEGGKKPKQAEQTVDNRVDKPSRAEEASVGDGGKGSDKEIRGIKGGGGREGDGMEDNGSKGSDEEAGETIGDGDQEWRRWRWRWRRMRRWRRQWRRQWRWRWRR